MSIFLKTRHQYVKIISAPEELCHYSDKQPATPATSALDIEYTAATLNFKQE
jgi:hypothetical protein